MKNWYASKTVIVNTLSLSVGLLTVLAGSELVASHPQAAAMIGTALAGVNIALRFVTKVPVG